MALTWNDLFLSGSVVSLHTQRWYARLQLKPQDLGIDDSVAVNQALALGAHRLAPATAFADINAIVNRATRLVDSYSLSFGFIFGARYVPESNCAPLAEKLRVCKEDFEVAVGAFVGNYDRIKSDMLAVIRQALGDASKNPEVAEFAYRRIVAEYPSAEEVRGKFSLTWKTYAIQGATKAGAAAALEDEAAAVRGVITQMVVELREEVTGKLRDVLALIQKGGKLQQKSIDSALAVLDHIDAVNVLGDGVLANQVSQLRRALRGIDLSKDVPESTVSGLDRIKATLEADMAEAVRSAELKLSGVGRRKLEAA